jgi:hypothetical protein
MSATVLEFPNRTETVSPVFAIPYGEDAKKSNHQANVVRIDEILPHPDPETTSLELILIGGYQVVVKKGQFAIGDRAVYIQPDSVVPQTEPFRFIWNDHVGLDGTVPVKRRRVTVRKFRGQYSEGLLLPVSDFPELAIVGPYGQTRATYPAVGEDVSDLLGITHYVPEVDVESTKANSALAPKKKFKYPKTFRGWFNFIKSYLTGGRKVATRDASFSLPTYDVEAFKNYNGTFLGGEMVVVTEKIHGSNARFIFLDGEMYAGSRTQWKALGGNDVWNKALAQNPWIEKWCRAHEGYALYGEVTPTQKGFDYGTKNVQFFLFDIRTPEGKWVSFDAYGVVLPAYQDIPETNLSLEEFNHHMVPVLYYGPFDLEKILPLVDGQSEVIGAKHIREGVVIKTAWERSVRGLGRAQLKVVSSDFYLKDAKN